MVYTFNNTDKGYLLKIEGDLDLYSSYNLKEDIKNVIMNNPDNITIDLSRLNYIDSAGLGFLIEIKKSIAKLNKQCIVENTPPDILRLFKSTRIDVILGIK